MRIKAICFDIDGTLYANWKMYYHTMHSFFIDPKLIKAYAAARVAIREEVVEQKDLIAFSKEANAFELFRDQQAQKVCEYFKKDISVESMKLRIEKSLYRVWEGSFRGISPCKGLIAFLEVLQEKEFTLGVLSDFPVQNKLRYMAIPGALFPIQLCAEETGFLKPHPKPFLELAKRCGCQATEILYVGNSYDKDILGAKNAGMLAAHFTHKKIAGSVADISFKTYDSLFDKLKKLMID